MQFDHDACYRIFRARDGRFDGRIFVGVHTTGIYCRPICPAPPPKQANVSFFETAVAAQTMGFRPCLRCRPEVSPRFAAWNGTSSTVSRALRMIEEGQLDELDVERFAARLGVGGRQLRRLFLEHAGAPPTAFAQMRRIHLAKQLLQETRAPVVEVAHAAGYRSVRRFNEAFAGMFGRTPGEFRRAPVGARRRLALRLGFAPPYDWETMLTTLGESAVEGVEDVTLDSFRRTVRVGEEIGSVSVRLLDVRTMEVEVQSVALSGLPSILARIRSLFDLSATPAALTDRFQADPLLGGQLSAWPGVRVPGPWDPFEHVVRTVVSHFAGRTAAKAHLSAFALHHGRPVAVGDHGLSRLFPEPGDVAHLDPGPLFPEAGAGTAVHAYAVAVAAGHEPLGLRDTFEDAVRSLGSLPGFDRSLAARCAAGFLHPTDALDDRVEGDLRRYRHWSPWRAYAAALDRLTTRDRRDAA